MMNMANHIFPSERLLFICRAVLRSKSRLETKCLSCRKSAMSDREVIGCLIKPAYLLPEARFTTGEVHSHHKCHTAKKVSAEF